MSARQEAADRVLAFLDGARDGIHELDPLDVIASTPNGAELTVSDLEALLEAELDAATTRRRVWLVYSSGVTTGAATTSVQHGHHPADAQRIAHAVAQLLGEDPLIREPLTDELVELLKTGNGSREWRPVTAYRLQHPTE